MPIQFVIHQSKLPSLNKAHVARVRPLHSADLDAIVKRMSRVSSTVSKADIYSVLEDYYSTIEDMVLEGWSVNTPHVDYRTSIQGTFEGKEDGFDSSRHRIVARVSPGKRLRKVVSTEAQAEKGEALKLSPNPEAYIDVKAGTRNSTLTPGGMGRLLGRRLRLDLADEKQGVFFVAADGEATRLEELGKNNPGELFFVVPPLAAGLYELQVRASANGNGDVRTGVLEEKLTVA
jgi:hypothetical protein